MESDNLAYMELAIHQAKLASESFEVPVGCVIIKDGEVIASGRNRTTETRNVLAFRDIARQAPMHILIIPKSKDGLTGLSKVSFLRTSAIHIDPSKRRFIF